jgi:hypothetical protein
MADHSVITGAAVFAKKVIKRHPKYDEEIHAQLVVLRNKLIAHSDQDYVDGRLFEKKIGLDRDSGRVTVLVGASVVTQSVHMLRDIALAERYLTQAKAAEEAASADLVRCLEAFTKAGQQFPSAFEATRTEQRPPIIATQFQLTPTKPTADIPISSLNPHAVLTRPPLTIGKDGYAYRGLILDVDLSVTASWQEADGSQASITWAVPPPDQSDNS